MQDLSEEYPGCAGNRQMRCQLMQFSLGILIRVKKNNLKHKHKTKYQPKYKHKTKYQPKYKHKTKYQPKYKHKTKYQPKTQI